MYSIGERITSENTPDEFYRRLADKTKNDLRVAVPGIVQSFDPVEQTVTVQPAIRERVRDQTGSISFVNLPLLVDVPVVFPRAGNFVLTMPPQPGDEVLVVFADLCIDAWWSCGGVQNPIEKRRHDLSDCFALFGIWSQPRSLAAFNTGAAVLQTLDGTTSIAMTEGAITLTAGTININGSLSNNGIDLTTHVHSGVQSGSGKTAGPQSS